MIDNINSNLLSAIMNKKEENKDYITGTVYTVSPLTIKIISTDDPISVVSTGNLKGIKVGSRLLLFKYLNKYIALSLIANIDDYYCMLVRSTTQSITTNTHVPLNFSSGSTVEDPSSMFDGADLITIPYAGIYQVNANARYQDNTTSTIRIMNLYVNSVQVASVAGRPDANGRFGINFNLNYRFDKDDEIQVTVFHATGSSINIGQYDSTYLNVMLIK